MGGEDVVSRLVLAGRRPTKVVNEVETLREARQGRVILGERRGAEGLHGRRMARQS